MTNNIYHKNFQELRQFKTESISDSHIEKITLLSKKIRKDILSMTTNACSGHVGGALSSADIFLMLWLCSNISSENINSENRDRIVISHGHTSSGVYSVLGNLDFFDINEAVHSFRKSGSLFESHPNRHVPGVEWCSGSLGQGLSVGCGFALASKLQKKEYHVFVVMGDGEQQKGQLTEAREFAAKFGLSNLTAIIDLNRLQASGFTSDIMPGNIQKKYEASGWKTYSINGHDYNEIYLSLKSAYNEKEVPVVIFANTIMGKGVSFIENNYTYHGSVLSQEQYKQAIRELDTSSYSENKIISSSKTVIAKTESPVENHISTGAPILYKANTNIECRTATGEAIYDIIKNNSKATVAVLDCDLAESVKVNKIAKDFPEKFIECGIQEHNAATIAGALSKSGVLTYFLDFAVFGIDETYSQHRMNDINGTSVKLIGTHCGLDVGEDGKTHQCIDYISLMNNLPSYKLIIPADANHTDRIIRYISSTAGNFVVATGRSKVPVIANEKGDPFYSEKYSFVFGKSDWIKEGKDLTIITTGTMVHRAIQASEGLLKKNIKAGVLNLSCPGKPDFADIKKASETGMIITYEDHLVKSGIGCIVGTLLAENELRCKFIRMGITKYGASCNAEEQYRLQGLDVDNLIKKIENLI